MQKSLFPDTEQTFFSSFNQNLGAVLLAESNDRSPDKVRDRIAGRTSLQAQNRSSLNKPHILQSAAHTSVVEQSLDSGGSSFAHIMQRLCCFHDLIMLQKDTFAAFLLSSTFYFDVFR